MRIGKLIEENPNMTYQEVRDVFLQQAYLSEENNHVG